MRVQTSLGLAVLTVLNLMPAAAMGDGPKWIYSCKDHGYVDEVCEKLDNGEYFWNGANDHTDKPSIYSRDPKYTNRRVHTDGSLEEIMEVEGDDPTTPTGPIGGNTTEPPRPTQPATTPEVQVATIQVEPKNVDPTYQSLDELRASIPGFTWKVDGNGHLRFFGSIARGCLAYAQNLIRPEEIVTKEKGKTKRHLAFAFADPKGRLRSCQKKADVRNLPPEQTVSLSKITNSKGHNKWNLNDLDPNSEFHLALSTRKKGHDPLMKFLVPINVRPWRGAKHRQSVVAKRKSSADEIEAKLHLANIAHCSGKNADDIEHLKESIAWCEMNDEACGMTDTKVERAKTKLAKNSLRNFVLRLKKAKGDADERGEILEEMLDWAMEEGNEDYVGDVALVAADVIKMGIGDARKKKGLNREEKEEELEDAYANAASQVEEVLSRLDLEDFDTDETSGPEKRKLQGFHALRAMQRSTLDTGMLTFYASKGSRNNGKFFEKYADVKESLLDDYNEYCRGDVVETECIATVTALRKLNDFVNPVCANPSVAPSVQNVDCSYNIYRADWAIAKRNYEHQQLLAGVTPSSNNQTGTPFQGPAHWMALRGQSTGAAQNYWGVNQTNGNGPYNPVR